MVFTQGWSNSSVQKFRRLWCSDHTAQIFGHSPAKNWPRFRLSKFWTVLLTDILNARIFNRSKICPRFVRCQRSLHLNVVPRNFLLQKLTILWIFRQNALTSLIAVKHSILSDSDDVTSGSVAWRNNTRKKSALSVQREVALFVEILGQIILDADYLLVERNWARIVLCMVKMLLNLISSKRALNHRGRLPGIGL